MRPATTLVAEVRDTSDTTTPPPEGPPQVVVDTTPPAITYTLSGGTLGQNGWYVTEPVKIEFSITDLESPVRVDDCPPVTCRQLTVKLVDETERTLNFQFAK